MKRYGFKNLNTLHLSSRAVKRNKLYFLFVTFFLTSFLLFNLFNTQIVSGEKYYSDIANPVEYTREIKAKRGIVYDRNGVKLVDNEIKYEVSISKNIIDTENYEPVLNGLSKLFGINAKDNFQKDIDLRPWKEQITIVDRQDYYPSIFELETNYRKYNNNAEQDLIKITEKHFRKYNYPEYISHIVGYVGPVTQEDLENDKEKIFDEDDVIGKFGVEKGYDEILRGQNGLQVIQELTTQNRQIVKEEKKVVDGQDIYLTIDIKLQKEIYDKINVVLKNPITELSSTKSVASVVEDINNGEILALVSYPTFNSNHFIDGLSFEQNEKYLNDPGKPLTNKALQYAQSPGSIIKPLTALTLLEKQAITGDTIFYAGGEYTPQGQNSDEKVKVYDAGRKVWGNLNVVGGICHSSNIFHVKGIEKLSPSEAPYYLEENFHKIGLDQPSGLSIGYESVGFFPTPKKIEERGGQWLPGFLWNSSYGQGDVLMTPIGAAKLASTIAKNGEIIDQKIVRQETKDELINDNLNIQKSYFDLVQQGMKCSGDNTSSWTGYNTEEFIKVADKTGTAETGQIVDGNPVIHGWEISYAPYDSPKYAISIFTENGGSGWRSGYISREIYKYLSKIEKI